MTFTIGVITASDKGSIGERQDTSGPLIAEMMKELGGVLKEYVIVPDEREKLANALITMCDDAKLDIVFTTGGTGFSPRDVTPEATLDVIDRLAPGISEAIRMKSLSITPKAMLSRAVAGIRKQTLIINLPGSPKGVKESLEVILPALSHGIGILKGIEGECGGNHKK
ncbi:MogA/MoaB family molybdenum cofactor biosynthesis protein [Clostridium formicaceticum]|uniref:Molybdenum cofactor biosynthesis protein n=1 Tax=Clostridium formicaceticum TaxID=1497 RepID=A0AAC9WH05_9CLOT|nr:MogA/MoaB family molybdenum cofactor biosynthesis protein [Clostridium formicaceticum]AOY76759.1 molybdenum cofactor biosynthesis protein [Clostridium formicaceticum]ARE87210.1 Molybdopterin adenylyltransferase [Clostridium formicaceticum]